MNNDFESVKITGRIRRAVEAVRSADGRRYSRFELTPADNLNSDNTVLCIAWSTRAELLERFASRGDLVEITGTIAPVDFIAEDGNHVRENNIIEATGINFPEDEGIGSEKEETA
jgi:hypothetical protein